VYPVHPPMSPFRPKALHAPTLTFLACFSTGVVPPPDRCVPVLPDSLGRPSRCVPFPGCGFKRCMAATAAAARLAGRGTAEGLCCTGLPLRTCGCCKHRPAGLRGICM